MSNVIDAPFIEKRLRAGRTYAYDPARKLFLNPESGNWVQNPIIRREFITSGKKCYHHPLIDPILQKITTNTAQLESLRYVLKCLALKSHLRIKRGLDDTNDLPDDDTPIVWIHHQFYCRLLGASYTDLMAELVREGILLEWVKVIPMRRFPTYRFADDSFVSGYSLNPITCASVDRKVNGYVTWSRQYFTEMDYRVAKHIVENFPTIDISESEFSELWRNRYWSKYRVKHPVAFLEEPEYCSKAEQVYPIIKHWNSADATEKLGMFSVDSFGNRLHYAFTYLPEECRHRILDRDGKPVHVTEIDLGNSQPTIFANLLVTKHGLRSEDHDFIRLVESNSIYEHLADRFKISRNDAKPKMMSYMYCKAVDPPQKEFEALYGLPALIAREYKTVEYDDNHQYVPWNERHLLLCRMMQRAESEMFREVRVELLRNGIKHLPVHDALYIVGDMATVVYAERITRRVLSKYLEIRFGLKVNGELRY